MMTYYIGNESGQTPGYLPGSGTADGYYWWEGGAMFGSLIDYWYYTGDATYNDVVSQALLFQVGSDDNYQPENASLSLGNDDQSFWAFSAMKAAELNFPNPPSGQPQWIPLVQNVFAAQAGRWDAATCGGGLRWQVFQYNNGYDYKNAISTGCFFNMAARLGKYTQNATYIDWAERAYKWVKSVSLIDPKNYYIYDGVSVTDNCTSLNRLQWTYNFGVYLYGAACMWNHTGTDTWKKEVTNILTGGKVFFPGPAGTMKEIACEDAGNCNNDQKSFKAYTTYWMYETAKVAPFTAPTIMAMLEKDAVAAAAQCDGGSDGVTCGQKWSSATWDGTKGVGQQMSAMEAFLAMLTPYKAGPVWNGTTGTSKEDPNAGQTTSTGKVPASQTSKIDSGDKAGASIVTIVLGILTIGGAAWVCI